MPTKNLFKIGKLTSKAGLLKTWKESIKDLKAWINFFRNKKDKMRRTTKT